VLFRSKAFRPAGSSPARPAIEAATIPGMTTFPSTRRDEGSPEPRSPERFWAAMDELLAGSSVTIDRPKGSTHPRFPSFRYPLDYGYLAGTSAIDGGGVDAWLGSLPAKSVTAVVCTVDLLKRDTETKLLIGCTHEEALLVLATHNTGPQSAILIERPRP
jgi:inorganic pyrophosphatase